MKSPNDIKYYGARVFEAVLEFKLAEHAGAAQLANLEALHAQIKAEYPTVNRRMQFMTSATAGSKNVAATTQQQIDGFLYTSADRKYIFQARLDGFALSRLAPYSGWEDLVSEAKRLWDIYSTVPSDNSIASIGVRFMNHLPIPVLEPIEDYFNIYPYLGPGIPQTLKALFFRLELPLTDHPGMLIIQQALQPSEIEKTNTILLDLDIQISREKATPLWQQVDTLRSLKNSIFQQCITDSMRKVISRAPDNS